MKVAGFTRAALQILICISVSQCIDARPGDLIGWSEKSVGGAGIGAVSATKALLSPPTVNTLPTPRPQSKRPERGMEVLSWEPRIFLYRGILTDGESAVILSYFASIFVCLFVFDV